MLRYLAVSLLTGGLVLSTLAAPQTGTSSSGSSGSGSSGTSTLVPGARPGGFAGRNPALRKKILEAEGGTEESEKAVALGLKWLALHQAPTGNWSLDHFNLHARTDLKANRYFDDRSTGRAQTKNDTAGAAFGVLPFLAAGITHKLGKDKELNAYVPTVQRGLNYLMRVQKPNGDLGGGIYSHALATIALCEAYGMTFDPNLKRSAQLAINYLVAAQDPVGGGWRYTPRSGSDTSVTGFVLMALKSGQLAGLNVPAVTYKGAAKWLDSCETKVKGGYGYTNNSETPSMTAVGLLCRMYLGAAHQDAGLQSGAKKLKRTPPGQYANLYYAYYATQVMHHLGGDDWTFWNEGPKKNKDGMRDLLISRQGQDGSWDPGGDPYGTHGGRIMQTSWSLLTLQVYYRHLPLFKRQAAERKEEK
ncbi:MAG TPA: hypothetical protein VKD72_06820 [Gemmataceae bacterium]|nr:hypothetical protein [Gemmataceae bacterium]